MAFVVKSRSTNSVVGHTSDVEEALVMEAAGFRVDGVGFASIVELAEAKVKASPDYNQLPAEEDRWVLYTSKAGRLVVCQVVRLFHPDSEGYPQMAEVVNMQRPDGSFHVPAGALKPVDIGKMNPALANALIQGDHYEQDGGCNTPKLTRGLRKKPE